MAIGAGENHPGRDRLSSRGAFACRPGTQGLRGAVLFVCNKNQKPVARGDGKDDKGVIDERASKRKKKLTLLCPLKFFKITRDITQMLRLEGS